MDTHLNIFFGYDQGRFGKPDEEGLLEETSVADSGVTKRNQVKASASILST